MSLPRPLSHSSLSMYAECPQKYKFKYIDKIPEKPKHFFSFGQSVHLALEYFYGVPALPAPTLAKVLAYFKEHWVSAGYKDDQQESQYFEDGKAILTAYYNKHIEDYSLPFFVEYNFNMQVDGVPVTGKVDRIDKMKDGRLSILDYKTGKALAEGRVAEDSQLTMYQMACEELLGAKVAKLTFYHLPSLTELAVERHAKPLVDALRRRVVDTAESIVKQAFEPKPDEKKCFWCDYKPICPVFKHQYAAAPAAAPADEELAGLIDRYGELQLEAAQLLEAVAALLDKKKFVRAFGKKFEASKAGEPKWEFADKAKVLEVIKKAGLYERILAPSAPLVQKLMDDKKLEPEVRAKLEALGEKVEPSEVKIKPLASRRKDH